jgi:hypothetical protein
MRSLFCLWLITVLIASGCDSAKPPPQTNASLEADDDDAAPEGIVPHGDEFRDLKSRVTFQPRRKGNAMPPVLNRRGLDPLPGPESTEELSFDVGRVIAGVVVTHTFPVKNSSVETITIKQDKDIHLDCGCSSITPGLRTLRPRQETDVTVTVRTGALKKKKGPFIHGGKLVWSAPTGTLSATSLTLRGEAVLPFVTDPQLVDFSPEEVKTAALKEIIITAVAPVDWSTSTVTSVSPYFQVIDRAPPDKSGNIRCKVKCLPPESIEEFRGEIQVEAQARLSGLDGRPVSSTIPMRARQVVDLAINPKVVPVTFGPSGEKANVKLTLRGEKAAKGQIEIEAIRYKDCQATWKLKRTADSPTSVLEVTLTRQRKKPASKETKPGDQDPVLLIQLVGGKSIPVPAVEVGPSLDAP